MTRCGFVLGLAATAALPLAAIPGLDLAHARNGRTFRAIVVDTKPLASRGAAYAAATLQPRLQQKLRAAFAGRIGSGPTLVVRIRSLSLAPWGGEGGGGRHGSSPTDYLEGDLIVGPDVIPLLVTQAANGSGAWYLPDIDLRRLHALADAFASWASRRV